MRGTERLRPGSQQAREGHSAWHAGTSGPGRVVWSSTPGGLDHVVTKLRTTSLLAHCCSTHHNAAMATTITVRNVPDDTRDELAARAARTGRSLQEYLRAQLIELAADPEPEAWLAAVRERVAHTGTTLSAEAILADLHADRR